MNGKIIETIVGGRELFDVAVAVLESLPECVDDSEELQRAVALDAQGLGWFPIEACSTSLPASEYVRQLGLGRFVGRRRSSRWN